MASGWEHRRRQRIPLSVPVMVTGLDRALRVETICETIDVSSSGALLLMHCYLPQDMQLRLDILNTDRITHARVVQCDPDGRKGWRVRVQLVQQTGNFWAVKLPPTDWNAWAPVSLENNWIWHG